MSRNFDRDLHFVDSDKPELTARYFFVLDALNFCFWPDGDLEYDNIAGGLKKAVLEDPESIAPHSLASIDSVGVRRLLLWNRTLPLEFERTRLLREVGTGLCEHFDGLVMELVRHAGGSASKLVSLIAAYFPAFRDHAIYRCRQVFFYKRAQIFVGDLYGAFQGSGIGAFNDFESLTMFADYRVPVVLRQNGILEYSQELAERVESLKEIEPGSPEEVEIRAFTVNAVERMRMEVAAQSGRKCMPPAIALDWMLWETGEAQPDKKTAHHRTKTIYY